MTDSQSPAPHVPSTPGEVSPAPGDVSAAELARALFDESPFSTVLYAMDGSVRAVNAAFESLFGLTAATIPAGYSVLADEQLDRLGYLDDVRRAFAGERVVLPPLYYDAARLEGLGRTSWTQGHFYPMRDAAGRVAGVVLVHMNLTARLEAEQARQQDEERLHLALEAGHMGAWEWDVDTGRVHWSETLQRIHGLEPGTFGGTFDDYQADMHPDDRERVLATIRTSVEGGPHHLEYRIIRPDGEVRWLDARGTLVRQADGRPARMVGVCTDVTDRRHAEEASLVQVHRLEEQAAELEAQSSLLQEQAADLESQQVELEQQTAELQQSNAALSEANVELLAAMDASEAARARAARSEAYVRGILGSIGEPFVVYDAQWRFEYVNEAAAGVFAETGVEGSLIGRTVWEVYPTLAGTPFDQAMRRAMDERTPVSFTEFYAHTGMWSEIRCFPMPDGGLTALWRDITARKQAEEAQHYLARASDILNESLDHAETVGQLASLLVPRLADWCTVQLLDDAGMLQQVAVAHVDPAKVEWAVALNQRYPPDPEARMGAHEVVRTGEPILLEEIPDALLVAAAQDDEHLRILREIGFASALTVPLAGRGQVIGAMSLVSAESGRRYGPAELALAGELAVRAALAIDNAALYGAAVRARQEADEANRAKAEFLTTMSHELRTPLNAIGGYAQLMEMGVHGPVTEMQLESLRRVQRSQQHLLSLINDVLNFAKLEAGRVTYDMTPVGVRDLVAKLEALVAPQLSAKAIRYTMEPAPGDVVMIADAEKVQQVLLNLLSNAIKFTPDAGTVDISWHADGELVHIVVSDSGMGIPGDRLTAIFEPFVQVVRSVAPGHGGTGLGLAISRDLARGMGGDLTVESTLGAGSVFTLSLKRAEAGAEPA